jgi:hypothetical protein
LRNKNARTENNFIPSPFRKIRIWNGQRKLRMQNMRELLRYCGQQRRCGIACFSVEIPA